jgi:hypothetical protein
LLIEVNRILVLGISQQNMLDTQKCIQYSHGILNQ